MEAADLLTAQIEPLAREVMSCMDLLLRWVVLRICEANTQCLLKVLDVTKALFALMLEQASLPAPSSSRSRMWAGSLLHWTRGSTAQSRACLSSEIRDHGKVLRFLWLCELAGLLIAW